MAQPVVDFDELTTLYSQHVAGKLASNDQRWNRVSTMLMCFCKCEATRLAKDLYGQPLEACVENLYTALISKFVKKKLRHQTSTIEPLLRFAARNDLMSYFRRSRSPSAVTHESSHGDGLMIMGGRMRPDRDLFNVVRQNMASFRFQEWSWVREAILAVFLTRTIYPGPTFLQTFGVKDHEQEAVYNAALYDINRAIMAICE